MYRSNNIVVSKSHENIVNLESDVHDIVCCSESNTMNGLKVMVNNFMNN